jgi:hypothetical protein
MICGGPIRLASDIAWPATSPVDPQQQEGGAETGPEGGHQLQPGETARERPLQHEEHAHPRHVAVVAQHLAGVAQATALQVEHALERGHDLLAAGMRQEAVEIGAGQAPAVEKTVEYRRQVAADQFRDLRREQHAQAIVLDPPAHDLGGVRPGVLAPAVDRDIAVSRLGLGLEQHRRGAVTEQSSGDDVAFRLVLRSEGQRAELDDQEQHFAARRRLRQGGGSGQAENTAGTAEPEDRQALDVAPERQTIEQMGVERGYADARGAGHDQAVDLAGRDPGAGQTIRGRFLEQVESGRLKDRLTVLPAPPTLVPVERNRAVTSGYAGVAEGGTKTADLTGGRVEEALCRRGDLVLGQTDPGDRRGESDKLGNGRHDEGLTFPVTGCGLR